MNQVSPSRDFSGYDFLDFGCSAGNTLTFMQTLFPGARGLGLDVKPEKIAAAVAKGHDARVCDITTLSAAPRQVRFVVMSHFLEHLPSRQAAYNCVRSAATVATEFVYVRQPWFDADGYLFSLGLKCYWSDWTPHKYHMTSLELQQCLRALVRDGLIGRFAIYGHKSVKDSKADCIHSLASPRDQHGWDHALHPPKPTVAFSIPLYRELCAIAVTAGQDFDALEQRVKFERKLYDTGANRL